MTTTFVKKYPRAKVSRHASLNGWVIDIIHRANARPNRVAATYATIAWADRAARLKLGVKVHPAPPGTVDIVQPDMEIPRPAKDYGTCKPCGRPMRPAGSRASDFPGTTLRQREGLCQSCNQAAKRDQK